MYKKLLAAIFFAIAAVLFVISIPLLGNGTSPSWLGSTAYLHGSAEGLKMLLMYAAAYLLSLYTAFRLLTGQLWRAIGLTAWVAFMSGLAAFALEFFIYFGR